MLSLTASISVGLTGVGSPAGAVLAASSSPFAASSPATTVPTAPTSTPATTLPSANTGEAWASPWFVGLLGLTVALGVACLLPVIGRREERPA
jgi:hypothetical protein